MHKAVIGGLWGDEGKGKIIDSLAETADFVVRFNGGDNAGHTIEINKERVILHLISSGILQGKKSVIANGVVINIDTLIQEINMLEAKNIEIKSNLYVSELAHIITPYHILEDILNEMSPEIGGSEIGTTLKGIGPAYEDKARRKGITILDLIELSKNELGQKISESSQRVIDYAYQRHISPPKILEWVHVKNERKKMLKNFLNYFSEDDFLDSKKILDSFLSAREELEKYVTNTSLLLKQAHLENKKILFEGAQGTLLDVNFGSYPYVTSSSTTVSGINIGTYIPIDKRFLVFKAFSTRVGKGPLPTEIKEKEQELSNTIAADGTEFGATTGRKRRIGWFDAVLANYAAEINSATDLIITKLDRLDELDEIKICTKYKKGNEEIDKVSVLARNLEKYEPVYEILPGWKSLTKGLTGYGDLPKNAQGYIKRIEELVEVPVIAIGTGPERSHVIIRYFKDFL